MALWQRSTRQCQQSYSAAGAGRIPAYFLIEVCARRDACHNREAATNAEARCDLCNLNYRFSVRVVTSKSSMACTAHESDASRPM